MRRSITLLALRMRDDKAAGLSGQAVRAQRPFGAHPAVHALAVQKRPKMTPVVRGRMMTVAMVYVQSPSDLQENFRCVLPDAMSLVGVSKTDPRTQRTRDFVRAKDAEAIHATGIAGAQYLWQMSDELYPKGTRKAGRGRYFFLAPTWLDSSPYECEYRASKGPQSHGYSDGVFRRLY